MSDSAHLSVFGTIRAGTVTPKPQVRRYRVSQPRSSPAPADLQVTLGAPLGRKFAGGEHTTRVDRRDGVDSGRDVSVAMRAAGPGSRFVH